MRVFRAFLFLMALSSALHASGVTIKLSGNQDPSCDPSVICITNDSFDVTTNSSGGGFLAAVNDEGLGVNITGFNFDLDYVDPACTPGGTASTVTLNLDPTFYEDFASTGLSISPSQTCTSQAGIAEYQLDLYFTPGIPSLDEFYVDLNTDGSTDPNGAGGWVPNTESPVITNIPEPGTLAAGGAGLLLVALAAFRRSRRASATGRQRGSAHL